MNLDNIRIVLVNPIYGGNVGSVCRAMMNMGLSQLALVDPRPEMNWKEAAMMACHAGEILETRRVTLSAELAELVGGLAGKRRGDLAVDVADRLQDALAEVALLVPVAQFEGLARARRGTRRHRCASRRA
mgnify:CR=1 FL=1